MNTVFAIYYFFISIQFKELQFSVDKETLKEGQINNSVKRSTNETELEVYDKKSREVIEYRKLFVLKI
ncbi:MAG: hypothetical protein EAX90_12290 [Candidatus Heimdallarchaeota archaeon]|nr:hypothetical protein [Candidatus Heimdallarchaeota archaeon]